MTSERERLAALRAYEILDTAAEKSFDDLTSLAAAICGTPISLVSFIDEDRQWFKSRVGLDVAQTPRDQAFCDHAIRTNELFVVEDTQKDARFSENALVTGDPHIRFYAGAPLRVTDDIRLGTLCVIDRVPRSLSEEQLTALRVLGDAVVTQLNLKKSIADWKALTGVFPICAWCESVRVDGSEGPKWQSLHDYIRERGKVTHGICPNCKESMVRKNFD